jgi:hypothetical protein
METLWVTKSLITLASPFITTILGFILARFFQNKPRLIAYYGYIPTINLSVWQKGLAYVLLFIGCSTVVYWIGVAFTYLVNITL